MLAPRELSCLLGDYRLTAPLKSGAVGSRLVRLAFAEIRPPSSGFKRTVRALEFDVSELAVITFLMARANGKPLLLLPAVVMARSQFPFLFYNRSGGERRPQDLAGARIAIRSYSVTTVTWLRGVLWEAHGVDPRGVTWVTFEEPHVAEFRDPPNVERAAPGETALGLLLAGKVDAAILGDAPVSDDRLARVFPDAGMEDARWRAKHDAIMVNHLVVVKEALVQSDPDSVREVYRLLAESRRVSGLSSAELAWHPLGFAENARNLEVAIDFAWRQGLLPRRLALEEVWGEVARILG